MSKHTLGPWSRTPLLAGTFPVISAGATAARVCIVQSLGRTDDEMNANALLISAAPDLLEACKEVLTRIQGHPAYVDLSPEEQEIEGGDAAELAYLASVISKAIAKATGGAA